LRPPIASSARLDRQHLKRKRTRQTSATQQEYEQRKLEQRAAVDQRFPSNSPLRKMVAEVVRRALVAADVDVRVGGPAVAAACWL
jgi:hypothetical protein